MPSKRPTRAPTPEPDDDGPAVEEDARVQKARERLRQANAASAAPPDEDEDEDEDDTPAPRPAASGDKPKLRGGWTDAQRKMESTSQWASNFKPDENVQFIKFLEDTSYVNFLRHWVERPAQGGQRNLRAWTCLKSFDDPCPLCKIGEKPQSVVAFNVAIVGDDGQLIRKSWDTTPRITNVLKTYANDSKVGPLTKGFFMVNKSGGKGGISQINISPIRASSLAEDYDVTVPPQEEFDKLERYTPEIVDIPTPKQLRDLANELADEDYED